MKVLILTTIISLFSFYSFADVDTSDLTVADEAIDTPSIDLEGQYQVKEVPVKKVAPKPAKVVAELPKPRKPVSPSERIRNYREQLEIRNQIMVQKKMEQIRLQQEIALARKLEQSMNQTIKAIDLR
jgi:hypothetical protein